MVKKTGFILLLLLAAQCAGRPQGAAPTRLAFADFYQQDGKPCPPECVSDSMEIVTWYPSPYNEYEELRLYPIAQSNSQCNQNSEGLMYYNTDQNQVLLCKETGTFTYGWTAIGGGTSGSYATSSRPACDAYSVGTIIFDTDKNKPYVCVQGGLYKPLDSDYDEDGVTDAVDANDNDFNDATAVEANVETGKTFYARGGSRKTGSLVVGDVGGVCVTSVNTLNHHIICNAQTLEHIWTWKYYLQSSAGNASARPYTADEYCEIDQWNRSWGYIYRSSPCSCPTGYTSILIFATDYASGGRHEVYYCKKN